MYGSDGPGGDSGGPGGGSGGPGGGSETVFGTETSNGSFQLPWRATDLIF